MHLDDARHYLLTTNEKFDAITSDPLDPWVQGRRDALHARVLRGRQGAPQPRRRRHAVRAAVREQRGGGEERGRDVPRGVSRTAPCSRTRQRAGLRPRAASGSSEPSTIDVDARAGAAARPGERRRSRSRCARSGSTPRSSCLAPTPGSTTRHGGLAQATRRSTRDRNLRLQYLAGLGLNLYQSDAIYRNMIKDSQYPEGLFDGIAGRRWLRCARDAINQALGRQSRRGRVETSRTCSNLRLTPQTTSPAE